MIYLKLCVAFKKIPHRIKNKKSKSKDIPKNDNSDNASTLKNDFPGKDELFIGINSVTRALEKDQVRVVVVSNKVTPTKVIQHFPILCALNNVALCRLNETTTNLAKCFGNLGLKTVICFGFKKMNIDAKSEWDEVCSYIIERLEPVHIDWLPQSDVLLSSESSKLYKSLKVKTIEYTMPPKNKKRKREQN